METLIQAQRDLGVSLSSAADLDEGLRLCVDAALRISDMDCGGVYLVDETSGALDLVFHRGLPPDFVKSSSHFDPDSANVELVMAGKPIYTQLDRLGVPLDEAQERERLHAIAVLPISYGNNIIGCLNVASHMVNEAPIFSRMALETIAAQIGGAIARLRAEEAMRESEERYRSLVESTEDSIYLVDGNCRYLFLNEKHLSRLDLSIDKVIGKTYGEFHSEDDTEEFGAKIEEVFQSGQSVQHEHRSRRDGRYFLRTLSPVKGYDGAITSVTVVSKDINEQKRAEELLRRSSERIKLFAYSVSHDLKSPATGIHGLTKLLDKHCKHMLDEKGKNYCAQILRASEQIATLIEQIHVFISTKETPLNIEQVDVKQILQIVRDEFSSRLNIRQIRWLEPESMPAIRMDRLSLLRILRNLIDNAIKYGGEDLSEIGIGLEESGDVHILSVSDNGIGMSQEDSDTVFAVFQRQKTSKGVEGLGLGLAIVKELAELHGGTVWAEPGREKGMTFYVSVSKNL
jgi:PAS domain S-box-containing protein